MDRSSPGVPLTNRLYALPSNKLLEPAGSGFTGHATRADIETLMESRDQMGPTGRMRKAQLQIKFFLYKSTTSK